VTRPTIKKKGKAKFTDKGLINYVLEIEKKEAELDEERKELAKKKEKVIAELEARGTAAIDNSGWRLTGVWGSTTQTDWEGFRAELSSKKRALVEKSVIDPKLVSQAVQAGSIDPKLLNKYVTIKPSKPYYRMTATDKEK
jgi:hypothetical protein